MRAADYALRASHAEGHGLPQDGCADGTAAARWHCLHPIVSLLQVPSHLELSWLLSEHITLIRLQDSSSITYMVS
jgi:hypothetical protein